MIATGKVSPIPAGYHAVTQFYGDRSGTLKDPFGHVWTISTHIEDVTPEEIQRRLAAMSK